MLREKHADKVFVLGIDGMDPRITKRYLDMGLMPNVKKLIEKGSAREDLVLLGAVPTITPPQWTTLGTGAYPMTHGVTGYWKQSKVDLDLLEYSLDSRECKAEPLWNVTAEAGKKTLAFHWCGCAWPPSTDSENLYVVDGSSPATACIGLGTVDGEMLLGASEEFTVATFEVGAAGDSNMPCVMTSDDLPEVYSYSPEDSAAKTRKRLLMNEKMTSGAMVDTPVDLCRSPLKEATNWTNAPADAKEFIVLTSKGLVRRVGLLLKNEDGIYDRFAIYKSKKDTVPMVEAKLGELVVDVVDDVIVGETKIPAARCYKMLKCDPEGKTFTMWISGAMKTDISELFHPKEIYQKIIDNCGYVKPMSMLHGQDDLLVTEVERVCWQQDAKWQADAINYLIEEEGIEVVFSHFHNIDIFGHMLMQHLAGREHTKVPHEMVEKWEQYNYQIADDYIGEFMHLLDKDWTIMLVSDHGLVASRFAPPLLGEHDGINIGVMKDLGYTVLKKDENGNEIDEIDWTKTKAVASRESTILLNLIGRTDHGIVDPADQFELEEEIMTKLYELKHPVTGHRMVSLALRNKDAVILGYGGPDCGDICYYLAEGYNFDHGDCLPTTYGECETSCSPIFVAAGKGIKEGFTTDRIIRQVDVAPTISMLLGCRFPAQCEGAPIYQIFSQEV